MYTHRADHKINPLPVKHFFSDFYSRIARRCRPPRRQLSANQKRGRTRQHRMLNHRHPLHPRSNFFPPEERFMSIYALNCAFRPRLIPGDHQLCCTGQHMHNQLVRLLKIYHRSRTWKHQQRNRRLTCYHRAAACCDF